MELPAEVLIHNSVLGMKGSPGTLLQVSPHGFYEANVRFGERVHRVLLPIAHARDPLANLNLTEEDFAWVTGQLCDLADNHCDGRIVSTLEGGYDLSALAASVAAHVRVLMERGHG
jgi:hypothetical protein